MARFVPKWTSFRRATAEPQPGCASAALDTPPIRSTPRLTRPLTVWGSRPRTDRRPRVGQSRGHCSTAVHMQMRRRRRCIVTGLAHRSLRPQPARGQSEGCPRTARGNSRWPSRIATQLFVDAGVTPGSGSWVRFHGVWRKTTGEWQGESTRRETLGSVGELRAE